MSGYKTYLFSYAHDGSEWGFSVHATSMADARARVAKMAYAKYDGELKFTIPGWLPWWIPERVIRFLNGRRK